MTVNSREAFLSYVPDRRKALEVRPVGALSQLAINLGPFVTAIERGIVSSTDLANVAEQRLLSFPPIGELVCDDLPVARLDIQLLANVIRHTGGTLGPEMQSAVDQMANATDQARTLTYYDIVRVNPSTDLRTATGTPDEAAFISAHRQAERHFDMTIAQTEQAIKSLLDGERLKAEKLLERANNEMAHIVEILIDFTGGMSTNDFLRFRDFYGPIEPGLRGASAQFSVRFPIIDELLAGGKLRSEYIEYIDGNMAYYGSPDRQRVLKARLDTSRRGSLRDLVDYRGVPLSVTHQVNVLSGLKDRARRVHIAMAKKHLGRAQYGTSGDQDPIAFLEMVYEWTHGL